MAVVRGGVGVGACLFSLYIYIDNLKKIYLSETTGSISKLLGRNVCLVIVQAVMICQKGMAARGQGLFSLYIYIENF